MSRQSGSSPVLAYLRELDIAARDLPSSVRVELRARTVQRLTVKAGATPSQEDISAALAQLGDPSELVAAERASYGLAPDPLRPRDVAAVYLLASGPFLFGLGVVCGLALLWASQRWPRRQRMIATGLFLAGAAAGAALPIVVPTIEPLPALLLGPLVLGPWSSAAYLAAVRLLRRIRASSHVDRLGVS